MHAIQHSFGDINCSISHIWKLTLGPSNCCHQDHSQTQKKLWGLGFDPDSTGEVKAGFQNQTGCSAIERKGGERGDPTTKLD